MHDGSIREVVLLGLPSKQERGLLREAGRYLERQFGFKMQARHVLDLPPLKIDLATWSHPRASLNGFDRLIDSVRAQGDFRLVLTARDWLGGGQSAVELLNRYQRLLPLPNPEARKRAIDAIFAARQAAGSVAEANPESAQAQNMWRWAVRLCCAPSSGSPTGTQLLQDAHDLAFFSNGSLEYLEELGVTATYAKVRRCLSRMSDEAICHALTTRQPALISYMIEETLASMSRSDQDPEARASA